MHLQSYLCLNNSFEEKFKRKIAEQNEHYKNIGENAVFIMISKEILSAVSDLSISRINDAEVSSTYCVRFLGSLYGYPCHLPVVEKFQDIEKGKKLIAGIIAKSKSIEVKIIAMASLESWNGSDELSFLDIYNCHKDPYLATKREKS